jgi:hypothetical protein
VNGQDRITHDETIKLLTYEKGAETSCLGFVLLLLSFVLLQVTIKSHSTFPIAAGSLVVRVSVWTPALTDMSLRGVWVILLYMLGIEIIFSW